MKELIVIPYFEDTVITIFNSTPQITVPLEFWLFEIYSRVCFCRLNTGATKSRRGLMQGEANLETACKFRLP